MPVACQSRGVTEPQRDSCPRSGLMRWAHSTDEAFHLIRRLRRHLPLKGKALGVTEPQRDSCPRSGLMRCAHGTDEAFHLIRRLRRHLPLKGKALGVIEPQRHGIPCGCTVGRDDPLIYTLQGHKDSGLRAGAPRPWLPLKGEGFGPEQSRSAAGALRC